MGESEDDLRRRVHAELDGSSRSEEHDTAERSKWQQFRRKQPSIWGFLTGFVIALLFGLLVMLVNSIEALKGSAFAASMHTIYIAATIVGGIGFVLGGFAAKFADGFAKEGGMFSFGSVALAGLGFGWLLGFSAVSSLVDWVERSAPVIEAMIITEPEPEPKWWEVWK